MMTFSLKLSYGISVSVLVTAVFLAQTLVRALWQAMVVALLLLPLSMLPAHSADGGMGRSGYWLGQSRVVLTAADRGGATVSAVNGTQNVYLVQSRVYPADGVTGYPVGVKGGKQVVKASVPFLVTPPLKRLDPGSILQLRVLPTRVSGLPKDRESLYFLSAKAIPSTPEKGSEKEGISITMALDQNIKLFWRPAGLSATAIFDGEVAKMLRFSADGDGLLVTNPTPYFVTFGSLSVNGVEPDPETLRRMVPPKGTQHYVLKKGAKLSGKVEWALIDEYGLSTQVQHATL
ncbi:fimbrial biogenesis chaperone [Citrobacter koseri]|uniref:fimbrial biogenesis chaperone n=1 Tax=Citrobacter koseri TaxID=545 RepID=UPI001F411DDC|nr:molecular chaperone [Citrobacter koseri]